MLLVAQPHVGLAAVGALGFEGKQELSGDYTSFPSSALQDPAGSSCRSGEKHFILINELAKYAVIQAHFVVLLTGNLQDTPRKTKAASSDTALPSPLG